MQVCIITLLNIEITGYEYKIEMNVRTDYDKKRRKQEISEAECIEVLMNAPRGVMAFYGENGYPYAIPMNQYFNEKDGKLYFYGAKEGLKLDLLKENDKVCFTVMDEGYKKEGEWALNIRSVLCFGRIETARDYEQVADICPWVNKCRKKRASKEARYNR